MFEIAGFIISGVGLISDLLGRYKDFTAWEEADLQVDGEWLSLALSKNQLPGHAEDYFWSAEEKVPTRKLKGTHQVVIAYNEKSKIKHRIVRGNQNNKLILMRRTSP